MTGRLGGARLEARLKKLRRPTGGDIGPLRVSPPPSPPAPNHSPGTMANPIQLSMFSSPDESSETHQGIFVPDSEIVKKSIPPLTNAVKQRNKRRAWYVQTVLKKPKTDG